MVATLWSQDWNIRQMAIPLSVNEGVADAQLRMGGMKYRCICITYCTYCIQVVQKVNW
jgi:hypothetical protein